MQNMDARSPYTHYQSFDLRTFFSKEPGNIRKCPTCQVELRRIKLSAYSKAADKLLSPEPAIPFLTQLLSVCDQCQWWYLRETFGDAEWSGSSESDYITIGVIPSGAGAIGHTMAEPWVKALEDESLYDRARKFPDGLGVLFAGGVR